MKLKIVFITSFFLFITGVLFKILHLSNNTELILGVGMISLFVITVISTIEVLNSTKISQQSKAIWLVCFLLFSTFAAGVYLFSKRDSIREV